jgi:hypothetical protein
VIMSAILFLGVDSFRVIKVKSGIPGSIWSRRTCSSNVLFSHYQWGVDSGKRQQNSFQQHGFGGDWHSRF